MESAAAWAGPYELQLAMNGTTEEAPVNDAQVWAPAVGGYLGAIRLIVQACKQLL